MPTDTLVPAGELLAQRGLFHGPTDTVPEELYARVTTGTATRSRDRLGVDPHSRVTQHTYFGRFPAAYWQRWTVAETATVRLATAGGGRVELWSSDPNGERRMIDTGQAGGDLTLSAPLSTFIDGGALWLEFATDGDALTVSDLRWTVDAGPRHRPASVVICTYNRVEDCLNTLTALGSDPVALQRIEHVYVVDQGSDHVDSRERYARVESALGDKLRYLLQPNLGGAGGFSRGMYEVLGPDAQTGTDVLLMDDDVLLDPEVVVRITAFANRTSKPTLVGGQMLRLLHPGYLFAGAEWADMDEFVPGRVKRGGLDDANLLDPEQDLGDRRIDADYNAWWCCLIPSEVIAEIGYPLPLFFQWDDIEFGYRAKEHGYVTVTLHGAGLWHADFDWKDLDEWNRYFSIRNAMICATLHGRLEPLRTARVILAQVVRNLVTMQYGLTATILKAAEDFLAGPRVLDDGGASVAAEVRALRATYPDTVRRPVTEVPRDVDQHRPPGYKGRKLGEQSVERGQSQQRDPGSHGIYQRVLLLRRLVELATGRNGLVGSMAADEAFWWHVSRFDTAVVTDASQTAVRVRTRDRATVLRLLREGARVIGRLQRELPAAKRAWQDAVPRLTSRENWTRLYNQ